MLLPQYGEHLRNYKLIAWNQSINHLSFMFYGQNELNPCQLNYLLLNCFDLQFSCWYKISEYHVGEKDPPFMRINRSFLSCLISHFQSEAMFKTVDVVGNFTDSRLGVYPLWKKRPGDDYFEMSQWPELLILIKVDISLGEGVFWLVCFVAGLWCWSKS